jgi:flagellin-specific chaperone FliS
MENLAKQKEQLHLELKICNEKFRLANNETEKEIEKRKINKLNEKFSEINRISDIINQLKLSLQIELFREYSETQLNVIHLKKLVDKIFFETVGI